jgi:hypothetical protein
MVFLIKPLKPILSDKGPKAAPILTSNGLPINLNNQYDLFNSVFDFALKAFSVFSKLIMLNKYK